MRKRNIVPSPHVRAAVLGAATIAGISMIAIVLAISGALRNTGWMVAGSVFAGVFVTSLIAPSHRFVLAIGQVFPSMLIFLAASLAWNSYDEVGGNESPGTAIFATLFYAPVLLVLCLIGATLGWLVTRRSAVET